jgi:nucleoid DNA-binding protein
MTKKEFVNTVAKSTEITEKQAKQFIETIMDSISKQPAIPGQILTY